MDNLLNSVPLPPFPLTIPYPPSPPPVSNLVVSLARVPTTATFSDLEPEKRFSEVKKGSQNGLRPPEKAPERTGRGGEGDG